MGQMGLKLHHKYCSYFPLLVKALEEVDGDVLELGVGVFSTPFLHWMCFDQGRKLVSYENHKKYYDMVKNCESDFHKLVLIDSWCNADIERPWGIVLVDHSPSMRRKEEIRRLADYAQVILMHDSQGRAGRNYRYDKIYSLFKYIYSYHKALPYTNAVSNFVDVTKWQT